MAPSRSFCSGRTRTLLSPPPLFLPEPHPTSQETTLFHDFPHSLIVTPIHLPHIIPSNPYLRSTHNLCIVRFAVTPKPTDVGEHLKPSTRPYHQEWWLNHLFYIPRGAAVIPCGGCTDTPTPCLWCSSRELKLRPMLLYHAIIYFLIRSRS